jgi:predicted nucleic acid-binding protein
MKAIDTPVLLALLHGSPRARDQIRRLKGSELATTEANLLELIQLAALSPARARSERISALSRLRQRITVLPIDARATEAVAKRLSKGSSRAPLVSAMIGALEAYGCEELLTDRPELLGPPGRFKLRKVAV